MAHARDCQWARLRDTVWVWLDANGTPPLAYADSRHGTQCMEHVHCELPTHQLRYSATHQPPPMPKLDV